MMTDNNNSFIGIDFSIVKPAATIFKDNRYIFVSWPRGLGSQETKMFKGSPVNIFNRCGEEKTIKNVTDRMRFELSDAIILSRMIKNILADYGMNETSLVALEGLSYGSGGNAMLQLCGYRYILLNEIVSMVPLTNIFTYAPISVKKTAGCSEKGKTKADMIEAFKQTNNDFSRYLCNNEELFKTKKGNWRTHLDDIVDSFWVLETLVASRAPGIIDPR